MSVARNRSGKIHGSNHGPRVAARSLRDDLQGARDALIAFDGFAPTTDSGRLKSVLERPRPGQGREQHRGWLQRLWVGLIGFGRSLRVGSGH